MICLCSYANNRERPCRWGLLKATNSQKRTSREETQLSSALLMPVTGWLRGTVKAVPSGDTVLIVANAGPTVRFRTLFPTFLSFVCCSLELHFFPGRITSRAAVKTDRTCDVSFSLSLMLSLFCSRMRAHRKKHRLALTLNALFSFFKRSLSMQW